jgi:SHS2 domain-containing protein
MASQMTDIRDLEVTTMKEVELQADDAEILLVEWLSELVYLGELEDVAFIEFDMARVTPHSVQAVVRGGPIKEHQAHIKAVTFSELDIRKTDDGLETVIVFDV